MNVRFFSVFIMGMFLLAGCSGYRFNTNNNPLIGYDIKTVAVPLFINRSVLPQLAAPLTKEIMLTLSEYPGLKVISGDDEQADAVLIGIVETKDHYAEVVTSSQRLFTDGDIKTSIGERNSFYYPSQTTYNCSLRLMLIKRPTKSELSIFTGENGLTHLSHPKIVLENTINITGNFTRIINETFTDNSAGEVNFVKNKGLLEKNIMETSYQAAQTFRQVILNAF